MAATAAEEVEVGALIGAHHVTDVEGLIAARHRLHRRDPGRAAPLQLLVRNLEAQHARLNTRTMSRTPRFNSFCGIGMLPTSAMPG